MFRFCSKKSALIFFMLMYICLPQTEANIRICGIKLTATLKMVCKHQVCGGNLITKQKRKHPIR